MTMYVIKTNGQETSAYSHYFRLLAKVSAKFITCEFESKTIFDVTISFLSHEFYFSVIIMSK